jgi:D-alanine--poly(phosphoribitol) ligase subunit 1
VFGGEGYPKAKLQKLFEAYPAAEFHNVYGPTECTCICSSYLLSALDFEDTQGLPPLGAIAPNFGFLIVDEKGRPAPAGAVGELCLTGPNVGKGYYNDPERTEAAFVQNPLNRHYLEIMYRTGDLACVSPADGKLHIQGRRDNQIKHMGYRIELEEIESALHRLTYVDEAAALHTNARGLSRIVAVIASGDDVTADQVRRDLAAYIPDYMIPSLVHREPALPKNANGKVDRRRLAQVYLEGEKP